MANLIYRESTTATIPTSTTLKGSPLSNLEIDGNFRSINSHLSTHDINISSITYDLSVINNTKASITGVGASGTWNISITGNAYTVTNGVYLIGDQTIGGNKTFSNTINGNISGNAYTVTNGVYTVGDQTIGGNKTFSNTINGNISGNAYTVTNGVYTVGDQTIGGNKNFTGTLNVYKIVGDGSEQSGMVAYFARTTAPTGWLKANGAAVSRTTYAALFSAIGTTFGAGDGSTTFNLPDLRGEFIRSWDDGRGVETGRIFASWQDSQNLSHNHGVSDPGHSHNYQTHWGTGSSGPISLNDRMPIQTLNTGTSTTGIVIQSSGGNESRPRNIALLACIKF